ncbi:MAG: hypothetical protein LJF04_05395 [Gemmatimonadetes bacterium]|nr:hypothetical protein [Gemmatimonadota bacterium]
MTRKTIAAGTSAWIVFAAALAAHLTSLLNGFANDDTLIVPLNSVVTKGNWGQALLGPYWQVAREGAGLYRPVTIGTFTLEWRLWGGSPLGFHAVNILLHGLVALLVLALLRRVLPAIPALVGALWFALQPVHVEAVANVVGGSELLAAAFFLGACILYVDGAAWEGALRALRLVGLCILYLLALGSKEIAATLPAVLMLLEMARFDERPLRDRLARQLPVYVSLLALLAAYVLLRWAVLGTVLGEVPAPWFRGAGQATRILTALGVWVQYLRLMVLPMSLSSDYAPGVISVATGVNPTVVAGAAILVGLVALAVWTWRRARAVSLGVIWFLVTILPVSNLLFPTGMLVAERTLYLPSVGVALAVGGIALAAFAHVPVKRARVLLLAAGIVLSALFLWRSETRGPTWATTGTVMSTLVREHPESYVSLRIEAGRLARAGDTARAAQAYEAAIGLAPGLYSLLVEAGDFYLKAREEDRAAALLREAITLRPAQPTAYVLLAGQRLRLGDGREAHRIALQGLARSGPSADLWALVSESYIAKGDLEAAVRARRAALGVDPSSARDWARLADLLEALGRNGEAAAARARAVALRQGGLQGT